MEFFEITWQQCRSGVYIWICSTNPDKPHFERLEILDSIHCPNPQPFLESFDSGSSHIAKDGVMNALKVILYSIDTDQAAVNLACTKVDAIIDRYLGIERMPPSMVEIWIDGRYPSTPPATALCLN